MDDIAITAELIQAHFRAFQIIEGELSKYDPESMPPKHRENILQYVKDVDGQTNCELGIAYGHIVKVVMLTCDLDRKMAQKALLNYVVDIIAIGGVNIYTGAMILVLNELTNAIMVTMKRKDTGPALTDNPLLQTGKLN